jgi:hypothetical protein
MNARVITCRDLEAEIVQRRREDEWLRGEFIVHPAEISDSGLEKVAGGYTQGVAAGAVAAGVVVAVVSAVQHDEMGW